MMPSFRKKVAGFIRQLSNPGTCITESGIRDNGMKSPTSAGSFIQQYLNGEVQRYHPDIMFGRSVQELPVREVAPLSSTMCAAYTGPVGGLTKVNRKVRYVDVMDPNLGFMDVDPHRRTAKLAQPEDLEEFMVEQEEEEAAAENNVSNTTNKRSRRENNGRRSGALRCETSHAAANGHPVAYSGCLADGNEWESNGGDGTENVMWKEPRTPDDCLRIGNEFDVMFLEDSEDHFRGMESVEIAGVVNWSRSHQRAYGAATTLYERHPVTQRNAGDPIADAFAICARENSALLVLADGVNWGEKSCLAARCAIHGCVDYVNKTLFDSQESIRTTKDIFLVLLRSLFAAHNLILQEDGLLTTLCVAFVCPLANNDDYVVCTCNVGDSLAYVFSKSYGVREITQGSHDIYSMRDMRDALGALGPVDGPNPELNNLTCSMTVVECGDIVFLTSDGISDNFDPVVGKFALPKEDNNNRNVPCVGGPATGTQGNDKQRDPCGGHRNTHGAATDDPAQSSAPPSCGPATIALLPIPSPFDHGLPVVEAHQRHALTLLRMEDLLNNGVTEGDIPVTDAKQLCIALIDFAYKLTVAKRRILEDPELYVTGEEYVSATEQKQKRRRLGEKLAMVPGKLDHASVVAYQVGRMAPSMTDIDGPVTPAPPIENLANNSMTEVKAPVPTHCEELLPTDSLENLLITTGSGSNKENLNPNPKPKPISSLSMVCHRPIREPAQKESLV